MQETQFYASEQVTINSNFMISSCMLIVEFTFMHTAVIIVLLTNQWAAWTEECDISLDTEVWSRNQIDTLIAQHSGWWLWRMVSSGILRRVALVRTDVSEEPSASFIRVTRIGELGTTLTVTSNQRTLPRNTKFLRNIGPYRNHTA
jgi:hypothetical protein